jgi:hypothetical protein
MRYGSKESLIRAIRSEHDAFCERLDAIPRVRCRESGVWGDGWTVVDLVAHLAEWQTMFLTWCADGARGIAPQMPAPGYTWRETPRLNRDIWAKHKHRSLVAVRDDFDAGYGRIGQLVERLPEEALLRPGHFPWTGKHPLTTYLGPNTVSHYRFGTKVLKRWSSAKPVAGNRQPNKRLHPTAARGRRSAHRRRG